MNINLDKLIELDKEVSNSISSTFLDSGYLATLFTLTHKKGMIKGDKYIELENSNEMGLLSYLLENKELDINVLNIIKMYRVLTNNEAATFRNENIQIHTGETFYIPTSKDNIEKEMNELCFNFAHLNNPKKEDFDDIFKFGLQFICIHPFSNGNGRMFVFLTELLLLKFGLNNALYLPLDALYTGLYLNRTTFEIRKASGFFYKMKEYEYESYIKYMKELIYQSYDLLLIISK